MIADRRHNRHLPALGLLVALLTLLATAAGVHADGIDVEDRPIELVVFVGLKQVPEQLVRNVVRTQPGEPYDKETVEQDIVRLNSLGRFASVEAKVDPLADHSVKVIFQVVELPLLADVQVVGNKHISDQELLSKVLLRSGDARDPFLIEKGKQQIIETYRAKGYFAAEAVVDEKLLDETGILVYQVREGPKVRVLEFRFKGNEAIPKNQLRAQVQSKTYIPIFQDGALNPEQLTIDVARIRAYYQTKGYLDALVGRKIELSPNQKDAVITFLIEEGPRYSVSLVDVQGNTVFQDQQILAVVEVKPGAVYGDENVRASADAIQDMYGKLGYMETSVNIQRLFHEDQPLVDVQINIEEGVASTVGRVTVRGNDLTKDKVVLREVRGMTPGRRFDRTKVTETEDRLKNGPFFSDATVTVLGKPEDSLRDVLIQVKEKNTGSVSFGAGISSDSGLIGAIELTQRNFDITDTPTSFTEMFNGRAFRGAGQTFNLSIQPGNEVSRYNIAFTEPHVFETDYSVNLNAFYFTRQYDDYDERRIGAQVGVGRQFGDVWSGSVRFNAQQIDISNIANDAPVDVYDVAGGSFISSVAFVLQRTTVDDVIFPTRGSQLQLGLTQYGPLGDYQFTKAELSFKKFWTLDTDYRDRKSVLSWRVQMGYIFQASEAPTFERFYAGGQRSFRGFAFRGVGPRGVRHDTGELGDDPVGGNWMFLTGLEYNVPIFQEFIRGVVFTDMGTVQKDLGFDQWRVSIGAGLRLKIPLFGQIPFAIDFAYPILKQSGDETQFVSFDVSLPLQ